MRYIVTLFWAVILGQVVGYIGGALCDSSPYDFTMTTIISLVAGLIVILISAVATPKKETSSASHS